MRLVAGGVLVYRSIAGLTGDIAIGPVPLLIARIALGVLLVAGLWTPVVATLVAILEMAMQALHVGDPWIHVLLITLGICLALLGPGAYSIDARLFGLRRIDIQKRTKQNPRSDV
jgi:uncharacterized membrane protein YphA (DoxX/SURF4 family)